MTLKERTRLVKQLLKVEFPNASNISVRKGTGTAACWVEAKVEHPRPDDCYCNKDSLDSWGQCSKCGQLRVQAGARARKATKDVEFSSYYSDDGMDEEPRDCFLFDFRLQ